MNTETGINRKNVFIHLSMKSRNNIFLTARKSTLSKINTPVYPTLSNKYTRIPYTIE